MGGGEVNGSGVGAEPRIMEKHWIWLEWKEATTTLGGGERETEPYFRPCLQTSSGRLSARLPSSPAQVHRCSGSQQPINCVQGQCEQHWNFSTELCLRPGYGEQYLHCLDHWPMGITKLGFVKLDGYVSW